MTIDKSFFINNRIELINKLPDNSVVFIYAGNNRPMSQDTDYRFLPDRNYYYLTGLSNISGKLVISKINNEINEYIFAEGNDPMFQRWHGKQLSPDKISELSGIDIAHVFKLDEFDEKIYPLISGSYKLTYDGTSIASETKKFASKHPSAEDIGPILTRMRMVKKPCEISSIREAIRMTEEALLEMRGHIKPDVTEMELYTSLEYGMAKRGCLIPAFATITALNDNAFYLHHSDPESSDGEVGKVGGQLQVDVGARYNGYCADISRVYFIGDKQEEDHRFELLELIRHLREVCWTTIRPGIDFNELNHTVRMECGKWLCEHGLLPEDFTEEDTRKYYWHNTGHHLGLDVHDISIRDDKFVPGNVLAIEPGVYIPKWHTGFRIEDDVLVTDDGCELLSSGEDSLASIVIPVL